MRFLGARPGYDLTYSDVFLVPASSAVSSRMDVSLAPAGKTGTSIPLVSANMNSVTGPRLAATLARRGGLGVLPQDMPLQDLDAAIRWVKRQSAFFDTPLTLRRGAPVAAALALLPPVGGLGIVVTDDEGEIVGCIEASRLADALPEAPLGDLLDAPLASLDADDVVDGRSAFDLLVETGLEFAPVLRHGRVVGTLSRTSALRSTLYSPSVDARGRLRVAAAVGINGGVVERARALESAGVDLLVIDTAHGDQEAMHQAVRLVRAALPAMTIVAGNVVTGQAVRELAEAGADIVKVGVGPGAMCTTRMMTGVGRPQFSAVLDTVAAAAELGVGVWADGGVRFPRDVALALAAGANAVMVGSWFAGTIESPGPLLRDGEGRLFKENWGMASTRAVDERFARLSAYERARKRLFAEGISGSTIFLDPARPSVEDLVDMITTGVRSALSYTGAHTMAEFHERALVGLQSASGYEEGKALPAGW